MSVHLVSASGTGAGAGFHAYTQSWQSADAPALRGRCFVGDGPTLHFLSGNGFCGGVYWPFLRGLLPDYGLFTHDIEGHGASEAPSRFSGINAVCRRVLAVTKEQKTRRPLVGMGHSFGAGLTLKLAAENPGLFSALVLLDPIIMTPLSWRFWNSLRYLRSNPATQGARKRRDRWSSREEVLTRLRGRGIYKGWTEEALDSFVEYATRDEGSERVLCCPKELEAQIFERTIYPWDYFPRLEVPTLILHGAGSYPFIPPAARMARKQNPRVSVQTLPGGHCFMQEDPSAATRAVREFLAASAPRT